MSELPLKHLTVADFSQGVAGPYCAMLLGDLGATVIKVEPTRGDWIRSVGRRVEAGMSPTYIAMNRNKQGFCIEMKDPRGQEAAQRLARHCDVVVESFRPGVMERFGLGHGDLAHVNPALVYVSVSGFGQQGPYVELPGADSIIQAMGGIMSINGGEDGEPLRFGMFMVDMITGMTAFQGVLAALLAKGGSGKGQRVNVSLLDAILAFQSPPLTEYLMYGDLPERNGNVNSFVAPSGVFKTRDSYLMFTVLDQQWPKACQVLELDSFRDDPRFATNTLRLANRDSLLELVRDRMARRTTAQWLELLREGDILCAPIQDYRQLVADPQVLANAMIQDQPQRLLGKVPLIRNPVCFGGMTVDYTAPPTLGEHTNQVLTGMLGYSTEEAGTMIADGVALQSDSEGDPISS